MCELALAVRLSIMAARKILEDVVEMLLYSGHTDHRSEHPKSCSFQVLFFVLTNLFFMSKLFNNILFVSYFDFSCLVSQKNTR